MCRPGYLPHRPVHRIGFQGIEVSHRAILGRRVTSEQRTHYHHKIYLRAVRFTLSFQPIFRPWLKSARGILFQANHRYANRSSGLWPAACHGMARGRILSGSTAAASPAWILQKIKRRKVSAPSVDRLWRKQSFLRIFLPVTVGNGLGGPVVFHVFENTLLQFAAGRGFVNAANVIEERQVVINAH